MARSKHYQHYCPVARSLEVIGEKWSLLIVRDLLRGPQRFTDLLRFLGNITPKWLTLRLRELEAVGIVERETEPGRREVWYRLTPKGRDLAPVVESLAVWGIEHALRPPLPGEPVHAGQMLAAMTAYLNRHQQRLSQPTTWVLRFSADRGFSVRFDGERWSVARGGVAGDVTVWAEPEAFVTFLSQASEGSVPLAALRLEGARERIREFIATFGRRADARTEG